MHTQCASRVNFLEGRVPKLRMSLGGTEMTLIFVKKTIHLLQCSTWSPEIFSRDKKKKKLQDLNGNRTHNLHNSSVMHSATKPLGARWWGVRHLYIQVFLVLIIIY